MLKFFNAVINIAIHFVRITAVDQRLYRCNDFFHMLGNPRINMRTAYIELIHYFKISVDITSADVTPQNAFFIGGIDYFIIDICKVLYMQYIVAFMLQKTADNVPGHKRTGVADMRMIIGSDAADINIGFTRMYRHELFFLFGQSIINFNRHSKLSFTE